MIRAHFYTRLPCPDQSTLGGDHPCWYCSPNAAGAHSVVAYADDVGGVFSHWPDAKIVEAEDCHLYRFTAAQPAPEGHLHRQRAETERARLVAEDYHRGQMRRYTGAPYIVHPAAVAAKVLRVGGTIPMIQAAWLHDVVEMCGAHPADLKGPFGAEVADLVAALSEPPKARGVSRAARKAIYTRQLADAPPAAQTIKLADILDNVRDIADQDPDFAHTYLAEKQIELAVLRRGDAGLRSQASQSIESALARLEQATSPSF